LKVPTLAGLPLRIQQKKSARSAAADVRKKTTEPRRASAQARLGFRSIFSAEFRQTRVRWRFFCFFSTKEKKKSNSVRRTSLDGNKILFQQKKYPGQR
jgi:hypothetical protein